jgi:hypothetical protein
MSWVTAQGTFQDLDFESANIVPIPGHPFAVTVANALPGWIVDYGNVQQSQIYYNALSLGATQVTLDANGYGGIPGPILDGNFSAVLQAGPTSVSISQTGQIPSGTQSLLFDWAEFTSAMPPTVLIGNDSLALFPVGNGPSSLIYGANVSAWAGQTEQLTFNVPAGFGSFVIDDISFSTGAVPEPSALALAGIGGVLIALYRRYAPKRQ